MFNSALNSVFRTVFQPTRPRVERNTARRALHLRRAAVGLELRGNALHVACVRPGLHRKWITATGVVADFATLATSELHAAVLIITGPLDDPLIALGLPRRELMLRHIQLPIAAEKQLQSVLDLQLGLYKPSDDEEFCWDAATARSSEQLSIALAFLQRERITGLCDRFRDAGLPLTRITATQMAVLDWALRGAEPQSRRLFVDVRGTEVDLAVTEGTRCLATRSVPLAQGDHAAQQIAAQARQITAAARGAGTEPITVVLGGEGSEELIQALAEFGSVECLEQHVAAEAAFSAESDGSGKLFLGAVALALEGFGWSGPCRLNLVPKAKRPTPRRWRNTPTYVLLAVNVLLLAAVATRQPLQQHVLLQRYEAELAGVERQANLVDRQLRKSEKLEQRLSTLKDFQEAGRRPLDALGEVAQKLPPDAWVNGFTYRQGEVDISGTAKSASAVLPALKGSAEFEEVQFRGGLMREGTGNERFQIQMKLRASR